jgi:hypothetical protein
MLRRSRKRRDTSIEPALAGNSGAVSAAFGRPLGIRVVGSRLSQYMRQLGLVRACAVLEGEQLLWLDSYMMATIQWGYLLLSHIVTIT